MDFTYDVMDTVVFDAFGSATQLILFAQALEAYLLVALGIPVWALHIPQNQTTYPQMTYDLNRRRSYYTLQGNTTLVEVEYSLDIFGGDKASVDNLTEQLRSVFQSFRGGFGGLRVTGCRLNSRKVGYDPTPRNGADFGTFISENTFTFNYQRQS
jgi:hypothetical protein